MPESPQSLRRPLLGVVIPAYKEANNIGALLQEIRKESPDSPIIVVDDSPDEDTRAVMEKLAMPNAGLIRRAAKGGRGSAVLEGIKYLLEKDCDRILEMDADFSHPPSQIPELLSQSAQRQLDLLVASRYLPESRIYNWPITRRVFSICSNRLARTLLQVPICDYTNGYRIYSRPAAEKIIETCGRLGSGFISLSEILVNLYYRGFRVGEVPTVFTNRLRGESSVTRREIQNALTGLVHIYGLKRELISKQ